MKSCEVGALGQYLGFVQMMYIGRSFEVHSVLVFPRKYLFLKMCQFAH